MLFILIHQPQEICCLKQLRLTTEGCKLTLQQETPREYLIVKSQLPPNLYTTTKEWPLSVPTIAKHINVTNLKLTKNLLT